MTQPKKTIHYNPFMIPARTFWDISLNVPRSEIPKLCNGLHSLIHEKQGACFYYPDIKSNKTDYRYEWHIPYQGIKFGIKLGMRFSVENRDLNSIEVFATYGDESANFGEIPSF